MFAVVFPNISFLLDNSTFSRVGPCSWVFHMNHFGVRGQSYDQIKDMCIFLLNDSELAPDKSLAVYVQSPGSAFVYCGAVSLIRPSAILSLLWPEPGSQNQFQLAADGASLSARIGISVEDSASLPSPDVALDKKIEHIALKVGENLFNFIRCFGLVDGSKLIVPMDALDHWFKKFQERANRDPEYLKGKMVGEGPSKVLALDISDQKMLIDQGVCFIGAGADPSHSIRKAKRVIGVTETLQHTHGLSDLGRLYKKLKSLETRKRKVKTLRWEKGIFKTSLAHANQRIKYLESELRKVKTLRWENEISKTNLAHANQRNKDLESKLKLSQAFGKKAKQHIRKLESERAFLKAEGERVMQDLQGANEELRFLRSNCVPLCDRNDFWWTVIRLVIESEGIEFKPNIVQKFVEKVKDAWPLLREDGGGQDKVDDGAAGDDDGQGKAADDGAAGDDDGQGKDR